MRYIIMPVILLVTVFCHAATNQTKTALPYTVGFEDKELIDAYKNGDTQRANSFFTRWEFQNREISDAELELCPKEVKIIYEVFESFYCEHRIQLEKRMAAQRAAQAKSQNKGPRSAQPKAAEKQEYLIIQNKIRFVVLDNNEYQSRKRKIDFGSTGLCELRNFRPRISSKMERKVLYLDRTHERALNYFFNETNGDSATCRDIDKNKEAFLAEKMLIHLRHWVRGYHYITFPQVHTFIFNSDIDKIYIKYRDEWNGGGYLKCEKQNGTWKLEKMDAFWME